MGHVSAEMLLPMPSPDVVGYDGITGGLSDRLAALDQIEPLATELGPGTSSVR